MIKYLIPGMTFLCIYQSVYAKDTNTWGRLANPGFENEAIKSTLFFTGNWRNEVQFYDFNPTSNIGLYTIFPADFRHLGWSESLAYREFALNTLINAGVNVINISYWGLPGTDNWAYWAPMQTSTGSHDELFDIAIDKDILIAPFIESFAATDDYPGFSFMDDFPGSINDPAPQLIVLIEDLVNRYLVNPDNDQWSDKWARVYDKDGTERYLISIIHVASNQSSLSDQTFAAGFGWVAEKIMTNTGKKVGFALDILPPGTYAPGTFKATPENTGSWLAQQSSILGIQCFIPEIWIGVDNEYELIDWKNDFASGWINTSIPFIHDISPGYDAHLVFPGDFHYGNNKIWRELQDQAIHDFGSESFTFNAWNGYTEGFAGVPTAEYGDTTYLWVCNLFSGSCSNPDNISETSSIYNKLKITPNPSNDIFLIQFEMNQESMIEITVFDSVGKKFATLLHENRPAGKYFFDWQPIGLNSGIFLIHFKTGSYTSVQKIVLLD